MDAHLEPIKRGSAVATGTLADCESQHLGGVAHWAIDLKVLSFGGLHEFRSHCLGATVFKSLHVGRREGEADLLGLQVAFKAFAFGLVNCSVGHLFLYESHRLGRLFLSYQEEFVLARDGARDF